MPQTNRLIVQEIAKYIDPDPFVYTRLALVNRDFYNVFVSDRLWGKLDVYDKKNNIFEHFIETARPYFGLILCCCHETAPALDMDPIENKYVKLAYFLNTTDINGFDDPVIMEKVFEIKPFVGRLCYDLLWTSKPLFLRLYRRDPTAYSLIPYQMQVTDEFCRDLIKAHAQVGGNARHPFTYIPQGFITSDLLEYALTLQPSSLLDLPIVRNVKESMLDGLLGKLSNAHPKIAIEYLRGKQEFFDQCPKLWDNLDACKATIAGQRYIPGLKFLERCEFLQVALMAVTQDPGYFVSLKKFHSNRGVVIAMIPFLPCKIYSLGDILACIDDSLWSDPGVIEVAADHGLFYCQNEFEIPRTEALEKLCDDYEWISRRIKYNSCMWNMASTRLKQDKDLLMSAFDTSWRLDICDIFIPQFNSCFIPDSIPEIFHNDQDVRDEIANIGMLHLFPDSLFDREYLKGYIADYGFANYPQYADDFDFVFAAVECWPHNLKLASPRLKQNPEILALLKNHLYRCSWIWEDPDTCLAAEEMYGPPPKWEDLDLDSALDLDNDQLKDDVPESFYTLEIAIELVKRSGYLYEFLPLKLKKNKEVQLAIEPFFFFFLLTF